MKKKVVHYISTLKDGGAQTQVILLCNNLDKTRYDLHIVCWDNETTISLNTDVNVITIKRGGKFKLFSFFKEIYKLTRELKPDLVHLWLPEMITLPAAVAAKFINVPIINSERRLPTTNIFKVVWYRDHIEYLIHLLADVVTTNFPIPIKRFSLFNFLVNKKKGVTVFNGVDYPLEMPSVNKDGSSFKIIYCGRFVKQKNVQTLLSAVNELVLDGSNVTLDLYGTGELETELRQYVTENNLSGIVSFKGYVKNWKALAQDADCFVLPTSREGMPNVLFEAASIGLPLICTDIEEISCHFTNNIDALLVPPKKTKELTIALKRLYDDRELRKKLAVTAFQTIQKYSVKRMVGLYDELYIKLLKN